MPSKLVLFERGAESEHILYPSKSQCGCHTVVGFVLLLTDYGAAPRLVNHILQSCLSAGHLKEKHGQSWEMNGSESW